jgi:hypothetical protein
VKTLLEAGIDPDITPKPDGVTPLAVAASAEAAWLLLAAGADKDRKVGDSVAIARACDRGREDVVAVLLEAGAAIPKSIRKDLVDSCARDGKIAMLHAFVKHDPTITVFRNPEVMASAIRQVAGRCSSTACSSTAANFRSFLTDASSRDPSRSPSWLSAPDAVKRAHPGRPVIRCAPPRTPATCR